MDYFALYGLAKEPFSNSPDPAFFYPSRFHGPALDDLVQAVQRRDGLVLVIGEVGVGKTTLCREFIRRLHLMGDISLNLILDPHFSGSGEFMSALHQQFTGAPPPEGASLDQIRGEVIRSLLDLADEADRPVALVVDEGQKIPREDLEALVDLLIYERDGRPLLTTFIFAQTELDPILDSLPALKERVSRSVRLKPLGFRETRELIRFRLQRAGAAFDVDSLFGPLTYLAIWRATGGFPRKVVQLCHNLLVSLVLENRRSVSLALVRAWMRGWTLRGRPNAMRRKILRGAAAVLASCLLGLTLGALGPYVAHRVLQEPPPAEPVSAPAPEPAPPVFTGQAELRPLEMPQMLGEISLRKGETLDDLLTRVLGAAQGAPRELALSALRRANPKINFDKPLPAGIILAVPSVPHQIPEALRATWRVQLGVDTSLPAAWERLRRLATGGVSAAVLPLWNQQDGARYLVCLPVFHTAEANAQADARALPAAAALAAANDVQVVRGLADASVLLADVSTWRVAAP